MVERSSPCQHYWLIEPPQGPTSPGVCKHCGDSKTFLNNLDGGYRDRDDLLSDSTGAFDTQDAQQRARRHITRLFSASRSQLGGD
ncbi:hypothetical protein HYU92_04150 [Candidatus Curtissbacteria bacterium]|nr:hypothetical protein [Candidatus Curtissbacteria bacterium]